MKIDGKKVTQLGHSNIGHQYIFESTNLKHCYLPRTLDVVDNATSDYIKEDDAKYYFIDIDNVDLFKLESNTNSPHGLSDLEFNRYFTTDKPVIFNFHGYPSLIHELLYDRYNIYINKFITITI